MVAGAASADVSDGPDGSGQLTLLGRAFGGIRFGRDKEDQMSNRRIGRALVDAVAAVPLFLVTPFLRHWHLRWGATDEEVRGGMPGDERVPLASFSATRAIDIDAPPELVWPWIVQMGYRRAGFYTYALLDNAGFDSADHILDDFQSPEVGDWMPMAKAVNETTAFKVDSFETNRWLLWAKPDSTWAWKLIPNEEGGTRLITRLKQRYAWEAPLSALVALILLEFGDFPMMRRMMRGIKNRAESLVSLADTLTHD
jgi:hypothetical protein